MRRYHSPFLIIGIVLSGLNNYVKLLRECMCRSAKVKTVLAGGGMDDTSLNESAIKRVMKKQGYSIQI